ncbi:protein of unknown function [Rhodovastum atsumiense]|nr:protein of unknown function [Rhodovastum atsumiense]
MREVIRMTYALVDRYCASYARPPVTVTLDIDDTCDVAHGNQQLALFHTNYDERRFLPIHVYDAATTRPVAVVFRPGKTPSRVEIRAHVRRMMRRIRTHWPNTRIILRGDSHYGRHEVMAWCEENGLRYIFGLSGNAELDQMVESLADDVRVRRAEAQAALLALRGGAPPVDATQFRATTRPKEPCAPRSSVGATTSSASSAAPTRAAVAPPASTPSSRPAS